MEQRTVTVIGATTGAATDARLDTGRTIADVTGPLAAACGEIAAALVRGGQRLDPATPVRDLRDGDVLVIGDDSHTTVTTAPSCLVEVIAGPDAGRSELLPAGRHVLGRETGDVPIADPLISRRHLELHVDGEQVTITDLGSCNGSYVDDDRLPAMTPTVWPRGATLRIGSSVLVHGRAAADDLATTLDAGGAVIVNRPPRLAPTQQPRRVVFPSAPTASRPPTRLPVLASLAPVAAGVALALVLRRWEFLAFALMSPVVMLGQAGSDRLAARRERHRSVAAHAVDVAAALARLREALENERLDRFARAPDLARLSRAAQERTRDLWARDLHDDDALVIRLGVGRTPAQTVADGGPGPLWIDDAPVTLDVRAFSTVGVCGDRAADVARAIVVQAVTLLGPSDLHLAVIGPRRPTSWAWARWLPHLSGAAGATTRSAVAFAEAQVAPQVSALRECCSRHHLVVVDGVDDNAIVAALAARDDVTVICVAPSAAALPASCDAVVSVRGGTVVTVDVQTADANVQAVADLISHTAAEAVARALAPVRDATFSARIPESVAWSRVTGVDLHDASRAAQQLRRRWANGPTTTIALGAGASGSVRIDLDRDGPHVLVAGTTGAGKSELLQSMVASLVASNAPDDLRLLLVDFKGGTAFGPCGTLPHTLDVLTDLDTATTSRALRSLTAEIRRREQLLAAAGAADIRAWHAITPAIPGRNVMPRLVIVVDEFATLAEELPEFLGGLVAIAQRGRALGVHLVLATQRPEGAVSADIRANTRLRICLAVARDAESRDVIDSADAVRLDHATPGRALMRIGGIELVEVQVARVTGPIATSRPAVALVPLAAWGEPHDTTADARQPASELEQLVAAARLAAPRVTAVDMWLPALPQRVQASSLTAADGHVGIGLVDLPDDQRQPQLRLSTRDAAPLLVIGGGRSGRTTAALTVATTLASRLSPDRLHIWAIDTGSGLDALRGLPHAGAVVEARDVERVERLLHHLVDGGHLRADRQALLVVDTWDGVVAAARDAGAGRIEELLVRLVMDGASGGTRVVLTTDRSGLTGRLAATIADRYCLRLADHADYALLGLPARNAPRDLPPGRALRAADLALVQFATVDEQTRAAACAWPPPATPPRRFEPLPASVPLHTLRRRHPGALVVGVRADDLSPAVVDVDEVGGAFLVAGPPRSGRSTALVNIAAQLADRQVVAVCSRRSALRQRRDLMTLADPAIVPDVEAAVAVVGDGGVLLVDDVDAIDDPVALTQLEHAVAQARTGHGFVVLAGATDAMAASFRGPVAQARRGRAGLLLRPDGAHDGELFGVRIRRRTAYDDPPGRGLLAMHGTVVPVQVPDPS